MLETQLKEVEAKIQAACDRAGRKREEVTLIAVSKTKPIEMLQEAYDLGVRVFGENKVQEITAKYDALPDDIHWHMIGHLQTNSLVEHFNSDTPAKYLLKPSEAGMDNFTNPDKNPGGSTSETRFKNLVGKSADGYYIAKYRQNGGRNGIRANAYQDDVHIYIYRSTQYHLMLCEALNQLNRFSALNSVLNSGMTGEKVDELVANDDSIKAGKPIKYPEWEGFTRNWTSSAEWGTRKYPDTGIRGAHTIVGIQISTLPKTKLRINTLVSWNDIIPLTERRCRNVRHIRRVKPCNPVNYTVGLHTIISRFHQVQAFIYHLVHRNDIVTCLCQESIHTAHGFINPGSLAINLANGLVSPCLDADGRRNQVLADFIIHLWHLSKLLHLVQVIIACQNQLIVGSRRSIFVALQVICILIERPQVGACILCRFDKLSTSIRKQDFLVTYRLRYTMSSLAASPMQVMLMARPVSDEVVSPPTMSTPHLSHAIRKPL